MILPVLEKSYILVLGQNALLGSLFLAVLHDHWGMLCLIRGSRLQIFITAVVLNFWSYPCLLFSPDFPGICSLPNHLSVYQSSACFPLFTISPQMPQESTSRKRDVYDWLVSLTCLLTKFQNVQRKFRNPQNNFWILWTYFYVSFHDQTCPLLLSFLIRAFSWNHCN